MNNLLEEINKLIDKANNQLTYNKSYNEAWLEGQLYTLRLIKNKIIAAQKEKNETL